MFGANPIRASIVRLLAQSAEPMSTGEIAKALSGASYKTIFNHIQDLAAKGLLVSDARPDPHGQRVRYAADRDALRREIDEYAKYLLGETRSGDVDA